MSFEPCLETLPCRFSRHPLFTYTWRFSFVIISVLKVQADSTARVGDYPERIGSCLRLSINAKLLKSSSGGREDPIGSHLHDRTCATSVLSLECAMIFQESLPSVPKLLHYSPRFFLGQFPKGLFRTVFSTESKSVAFCYSVVLLLRRVIHYSIFL